MPRVERQLHDYFDAGVERISVEDVIAQAAVRETRLEPLKTQRNLRPAWAAVGAFVATVVALGGLAAALSIAERLTGDFGSDAADVVQADGGTVGVWLVAGLVAAVAAAAVTWMVRRPTKHEEPSDGDEGKVRAMETIENTSVKTTTEPGTPSRWPIVLIVVLAIAVVGLVAWMTLAMRPNSPNAAPPEIVELMEGYNAAWNAHDADALAEVVTPNYRIYGPEIGNFDHDIESLRSNVMPLLDGWDWQVSHPGPVYALSNGAGTWYVTEEGSTITRQGSDHNQNGVLTVVERDGEFLVSEHYMVGG